nr:phage tail domain-containing protein [uncultured Intestinibacter sp.]
MKKKLIFNNICSEELGIIVVEGPPEVLAQEEYEEIIIEGRNGTLIENKGTFPNIEKSFILTTIDLDQDIDLMVEKIKTWLFNIKDNKLLYAIPNRYNIVKKVIIDEDIKTTFEEYGDFTVKFICEPFYYDLLKKDITVTEKETKVYNNGDFNSSPIIIIYGTGDLQLTINNTTVQINNVDERVLLDSKLFLCLDKDNNNKSIDMIGNFPTLDIGENTITWVGNITKLDISPRIIYR